MCALSHERRRSDGYIRSKSEPADGDPGLHGASFNEVSGHDRSANSVNTSAVSEIPRVLLGVQVEEGWLQAVEGGGSTERRLS